MVTNSKESCPLAGPDACSVDPPGPRQQPGAPEPGPQRHHVSACNFSPQHCRLCPAHARACQRRCLSPCPLQVHDYDQMLCHHRPDPTCCCLR